jgi:hypothetical protein
MGVRLSSVLVLAAACGSVPEAQLVREPSDATDAPRVLAVLGSDVLLRHGDELERVDPAGGAVRWKASAPGYSIAPPAPGARAEIWVFGDELLRINSENGMNAGATPLPTTGYGKWMRAADTLLRLSQYGLTAHDLADGAERWKVDGELSEYHYSVSRDAIWVFRDSTLCGYGLDDGAERGCVPASAGTAKAIPGGDLVLVQTGAELIAYDARRTKEIAWRTPVTAGQETRDLAVGADWILATSIQRGARNGPYELFALRTSDGARMWQRSSQPGIYFGYLGVDGNLISWYDSGDTTQWALRLPSGPATRIHEFKKTFVMATDATGVAPAVPDGDPRVGGDLVVITDFDRDWVYRVAR